MIIPKYRAWNKRLKKMQQVLDIHLDPEFGGVSVWGRTYIAHDTGEHEAEKDFWGWQDIELMPWTEHQDRNGNDVYEDDLLLYRYPTGKLIYRAVIGKYIHDVDCQDYAYHGLYFIWENETTSGMETDHVSLSKMEVIGNVYQHPHLLTGSEVQP